MFQNAGPTVPTTITHFLFAKVFRLSTKSRRKIINAAEIADYTGWLEKNFGSYKMFRKRESLWKEMVQNLDSRPIEGMEFGVAWGYATNFWLKVLNDSRLVVWRGFDRFTGLPRNWRNHKIGTFDAGGSAPNIGDPRVLWHVGDIENTISTVDTSIWNSRQLVVLFDLDLFEPSLYAWNFIKGKLKSGDLVYFDEAYDADERELLDNYVLKFGKFKCIGATPLALGLLLEDTY